MPDTAKTMYLPDTLSNWPWSRAINPHYEEVKAQSSAWLRGFSVFNPRSQYACDKGDPSLAAALAYPLASKEHLRTGCDLAHVIFVIDEYTEAEDAEGVRSIVEIVLDAVSNPSKARPKGEVVVGEIARQFWERAKYTASTSSQRHFLESFTAYLKSNIEEAADRDRSVLRTIDSYFPTRRDNIASRPGYALLELSLDLPDDVIYHPRIVELARHITDLVIIDNDLVSYNKEQATGDDRHNILTILMRQYNVDLHGAVKWAVEYHTNIEKRFIEGLKAIPTWGDGTDRQVERYLQGIANWPRASDCFNFESWRYLGSKGVEIQKTRCVPLLPRKMPTERDPSRRRENVVVPVIEDLEGDVQATQA